MASFMVQKKFMTSFMVSFMVPRWFKIWFQVSCMNSFSYVGLCPFNSLVKLQLGLFRPPRLWWLYGCLAGLKPAQPTPPHHTLIAPPGPTPTTPPRTAPPQPPHPAPSPPHPPTLSTSRLRLEQFNILNKLSFYCLFIVF